MRILGILLALLGIACVISGPGAADLLGGGIPLTVVFLVGGVGIGVLGGFIINKYDHK